MNLSKILSVEGKTNLFKHVANGRNGIIVENIDTNKRTMLHDYHKISVLNEISMYEALGNDKPLAEIFEAIAKLENNGATSVTHTASEADVRAYFESIYPTYHKQKVKLSDIRKAIEWYNILSEKGLLLEDEATTTEDEPKKVEVAATTKTATAKASKNTGAKPNSKSAAKNTNTVRKMA